MKTIVLVILCGSLLSIGLAQDARKYNGGTSHGDRSSSRHGSRAYYSGGGSRGSSDYLGGRGGSIGGREYTGGHGRSSSGREYAGGSSGSGSQYEYRGSGSSSSGHYVSGGSGSSGGDPYATRGSGSSGGSSYIAQGGGSSGGDLYPTHGSGSSGGDPYRTHGSGSSGRDPYPTHGGGSSGGGQYEGDRFSGSSRGSNTVRATDFAATNSFHRGRSSSTGGYDSRRGGSLSDMSYRHGTSSHGGRGGGRRHGSGRGGGGRGRDCDVRLPSRLREGYVGARGGRCGFPFMGGAGIGEEYSDGGVRLGIGNGIGTGNLRAFMARRRSGAPDQTSEQAGLGPAPGPNGFRSSNRGLHRGYHGMSGSGTYGLPRMSGSHYGRYMSGMSYRPGPYRSSGSYGYGSSSYRGPYSMHGGLHGPIHGGPSYGVPPGPYGRPY